MSHPARLEIVWRLPAIATRFVGYWQEYAITNRMRRANKRWQNLALGLGSISVVAGVVLLIVVGQGAKGSPLHIRELWWPLLVSFALIVVPIALAREKRGLMLLGAAVYVVVRLAAVAVVWFLRWMASR